jgi:single-strand DNA-binding protein
LAQVCSLSRFSLSSVGVLFPPRIFLGTASGQFLRPAALGFGSSRTPQVPPIKHPLALGAAASRFRVPQENGAIKRRKIHVFLGKDPEKRQVRGNGTNFTVISVATQPSWKDGNDEWQSRTEWHRVVAFNRLGASLADTLHKGDHVLVDGMLVSSKFDRENGKSKKAKAAKVTVFWSVRANSVRRLSRAESEVPAAPPSPEAGPESGDAPF